MIENLDANSEIWIYFDRNLFAEEESEEAARRLQENSVTMGKMQELQTRMEKLSLQKKARL
jgi:hypothetical protein